MVQVDQIFTLHSFEHVEFRPVEISKLPCAVSGFILQKIIKREA
jgi:hypothetical protein